MSTYKLEEIPRTAEEATIEAAPPALPKPKASYGEARPWFLWLVGGEILLVIGLALFLLLHPSSIPVVVSGFSWERNVPVERLTTVTENGWSVPTGGRTISRRQERHHYESVFDHYETRYQHICEDVPDGYETETEEVCERVQSGTERYVCGSTDRGDGTFEDEYCDEPVYSTECHTESRQVPKYRQACHDEPYQAPVYRQEPRYATKYTYEVEKWVYSRTPSASGASHNAAWPELSLAANERESGRGEQYVVRFKDKKGQVYSYLPGFEEWQTFEEGQKLRIEADADRRVTQVEVGK